MKFLPNALDNLGSRFCLLSYRRKGHERQSCEENSLLLLIEGRDGVQVLFDPQWQDAVPTADHEFIHELISDFAQRAKSDAASLFAQTRSLNSGPLITQTEGTLPTSDPFFLDSVQRFVKA